MGRDHLQDLGTDGKAVLKYILGKLGWRAWNRFVSGQGPVAGSLEHGNEPRINMA